MDLGFFWRSKVILSSWILLPLALMGGVGGIAFAYHHQTLKSLETCRQVNTELPQLQQQIASGRDLLRAFVRLPDGTSDPAEALRGRVNEASRASGFTIDSLVVSLNAEGAAPSPVAESQLLTPVFSLTLNGEGSYLALTRFIAELEGRRSLTAVESVALSIVRSKPEPFYNAKITLLCRMVTNSSGT
jgi:hypothetical protein